MLNLKFQQKNNNKIYQLQLGTSTTVAKELSLDRYNVVLGNSSESKL